MKVEDQKMLAIQRHCYRYVVIGLGKRTPQLNGTDCNEPPCTPSYPGIASDGQWENGYIQIKPVTDSAEEPQFRPLAISAVDFPSLELAQLWLGTTTGANFIGWYDQIIIARVYNG